MFSYLRVFKSIGSNFSTDFSTGECLLLRSDLEGVCFPGVVGFSKDLALGVTFPDFIFFGEVFYIFII